MRIAGGYGASSIFLSRGCRSHGVAIRLGAVVNAIDVGRTGALVRCANGDAHECDAVVLTVPLPLLNEIVLPPTERERAAAAAHIGFGNVIKILMRFETRWWLDEREGSRRSDVPAFGSKDSGLVDAASRRSSRAHGLVRRAENGRDGSTSTSMNWWKQGWPRWRKSSVSIRSN